MKDRIFSALAAGAWEKLALEISSRQRAALPLLDEVARVLPVAGGEPWHMIPLVPARLFKERRIAGFAPDEEAASFRSSGTTGSPGVRPVRDLDVYRESVLRGFARYFPDAPARRFALLPSPSEAPHSSLSRMAEFLGCEFLLRHGAIEADLLAEASGEGKAIYLFGTALSFLRALDDTAIPALPHGSLLLETGGYKGENVTIPREELHARLAEAFGVGRERIFSEYGMSETFSQGYAGADGRYGFPPWCRVRIVSPEGLREAPPGERGLVALYDLANLDATIGLLTEDIGTWEGGLVLHGRAEGAERRGCSLALDRILSRG